MTEFDPKRLPPLSERLSAIVSMTDACDTAADIGCDHGYVGITLCLTGICQRCIASDVREGPAARARENAAEYGVSGLVDVRTGSGLSTLGKKEASCIIISGMGGEMILSILKEDPEKASAAKELILGPQSETRKIRRFLSSSGYEITDEKMIEEGGKYYPLIKAVYDGQAHELTEEEQLYGPVLIRNRDAVLADFLRKRYDQLTEILSGIRDSKSERTSRRYKELSKECESIRKAQIRMKDDCVIILASASPRRAELLHQIGIDPVILPADIDENIDIADPGELVKALSEKKCRHTAEKAAKMPEFAEKDLIILAADTIVTLDREILGKPADEEDAFEMLKRLSGREHEVLTGVCLASVKNGKIREIKSFAETTAVKVCDLSEEEIKEYIASGEPSDKAGAYGIQGLFAKYVESIDGNYANVVGLPVSAVYQTMKGMKRELQGDSKKTRRRFSPVKRRRLG